MPDHRQVELRRWIQEAAATSVPVELTDVLARGPLDVDRSVSDEVASPEPPFIDELRQKQPTTWTRRSMLAVAAAVIAIAGFAFTLGGNGSEGNDVSAEQDEPTDVEPVADATTTATAASPSGPADVSTVFWEAVVSGDREVATELVAQIYRTNTEVLFGRAWTLAGQFDWHEAVGFKYQFTECVDTSDITAECTVAASNAWSEALGVDPVPDVIIFTVIDGRILQLLQKEPGAFPNQWVEQVSEPFAQWVEENHPDDAAIMFEEIDLNPEILDLYKVNTARFVEAQQTE